MLETHWWAEYAYGTFENAGVKQHVRAIAVHKLEARLNLVDARQGGAAGVRRVLYQDSNEIIQASYGHKA